MGSKSRLAKHLLPIILHTRKKGQYYVEPFVGGCNMIDKVDGNRIGGDANRYLIALWQGLQQGVPVITKIDQALYRSIREQYYGKADHGYNDFEIGWVGFMASKFGAFFQSGYSGSYGGRAYIQEQMINTLAQVPAIIGVSFHHCEYDKLVIPDGAIIYCDPPYADSRDYRLADVSKFNTPMFWEWCRKKSEEGFLVFISEYTAPKDFTLLYEKPVKVTLHLKNVTFATERLYIHESRLKNIW